MNTNLLAIVNRIVAEQGEGILTDAKRLFPYFSDYAKNENKEERVAFGRCIEYGAYQALKNTNTADERRRVKAGLANQVNTKTGVDRKRCADALDLLEAVMFKSAQQPSLQQPQYSQQPQYTPQNTSPAGNNIQTNKGVWGGIAVAVVVFVLVVNYCSNRPSVQPYTPGTASPAPSAPAQSSGGAASPAPAQSQTPAQSNKVVDLWQTESVSVAKSEMYKLCNRFKYYESSGFTQSKSNFIKEWGNSFESIYNVEDPIIVAFEDGAEVIVIGVNRTSAFSIIFTNTNYDSYQTTDSRDKSNIDSVLAFFSFN
ncbi:MAG: hypothetical protein LBC76_10220 [Treponema sp.]|jgi:hypothetical protein|nr:hypothetical protein [Treponema sp.]